MKAYKFLYIGLLALVPFLFSQCTDAYYGYNKTGIDDVEGDRDAYFLRQHLTKMQNWIIPTAGHANQFSEQLMAGNFSGYIADVSPGFNNKNFATYAPESGWVDGIFNDNYKDPIGSYARITEMTKDPIFLSVAKVCKVMVLNRVTDIYGPVPYTQIGINSGAYKLAYDAQDVIYSSMINDLNEAIEVLSKNKEYQFSPKADRVYDGKAIGWLKLANSVKLRLAIRMSKANPALAKKSAEEVMADPTGPIMSNADNAALKLIAGQTNPYKIGMDEWNGGDSRIGADITSYMNGFNDARRAKYFDPSAFEDHPYTGFRSGVTIPSPQSVGHQYSNMSESIFKEQSVRLMSAAEIAFLRAEGALRGWSMKGSAKELYQEGIRLSFDQWGLASDAAAYIQDAKSTPARYIDPLNKFTYTGTPSNVTIAWDDKDATIGGKNFERIITQKWIANFPNGVEAWSEFRRTGYPKLMPVLVNRSSVVSTERMARRLAYPQSEYRGNGTNVNEAVAKYLGGPDNMATDLWWAR